MLSIAALALSAATVVAPVQNAPVQDYDVVGNVFSADQRRMIGRDKRCGDAREAVDRFAESDGKDVKVALVALKAVEHCASMSRVGDWNDYYDYLWTAAAGIAYDIGMVGHTRDGFEIALEDARNVSGFQAPAVQSIFFVQRSGGLSKAQAALAASAIGAPIQNSKFTTKTITHTSGYSGIFGALATQVGAAAERALDVSGSDKTK